MGVFNRGVSQLLLFPDPRPLVDRLGVDFFRQAPEYPGVYLMYDAAETVLYVGKAKNLRKRLGCYRVANPDRMRNRQLKLLRAVTEIQFERCTDEQEALARESELLLRLRPRFNRAGTWPGTPTFIKWKTSREGLALELTEERPQAGFFCGPMRSGATSLFASLARLAWCAIHHPSGYTGMPQGYWAGWSRSSVFIPCLGVAREIVDETARQLVAACEGELEQFRRWFAERTRELTHAFEIAALELDFERIAKMEKSRGRRTQN